MAAGCRIRHHYELSHNLFDCWTEGCQTTHLDLPPQLQAEAAAVNDLKAMPLAQLESGKSGGMFSRH